jgi:hypothetical protein
MTQKWRCDVVEAVRRSYDTGAQMAYLLDGDLQQSGGNAQNQTENGPACANTQASNRAGGQMG